MAASSPLELLKQKDILLILQGDTPIAKSTNGKDLTMPYLSGPRIIEISNQFGLSCSYQANGGPSRWELMKKLLDHCIQTDSCSNLISYLFSRGQFINHFNNPDANETEATRQKIISSALYRVNAYLELGGHELKEINGSYCIFSKKSAIELDIPAIKHVDRTYIAELAKRANGDIDEGGFDSAITKARTLLEEVFCGTVNNLAHFD